MGIESCFFPTALQRERVLLERGPVEDVRHGRRRRAAVHRNGDQVEARQGADQEARGSQLRRRRPQVPQLLRVSLVLT